MCSSFARSNIHTTQTDGRIPKKGFPKKHLDSYLWKLCSSNIFQGVQCLYISPVSAAKLSTCPSKMSDDKSKSFVTPATMPMLQKILIAL